MELRPYKDADFEAIYALDVLCFAPRFRFSRSLMGQVVGGQGAIVCLACILNAEGAEHVVGFCAGSLQVERGEQILYVATLDVAPESRGRGFGRLLVRSVEERARAVGAGAAVLHVWTRNAAGIRVYEGLGYQRRRLHRAFYGAGFDAWLYRKPLL